MSFPVLFGNSAVARGLVLDADPTFRGRVLDADPLNGRYQSWDNDPAYADRVGRYRAGGPYTVLTDKEFAKIFTFSRASKAWDFDAYGLLSEHAADAIRQGYDPATGLPASWLLEGAATNNLLLSADLSQSYWTKNNLAPVQSATRAPDGTFMWDLVEDTTTATIHNIFRNGSISLNAGDAGVASVFACEKTGGAKRYLFMTLTGPAFSGGNSAVFDLATGSILATTAGATATIRSRGKGIYRCSVSAVAATSGTMNFHFRPTSTPILTGTAYDGDGVSGITAWGAQTEFGTYPSSYNPTAGVAVTRAADALSIGGAALTQLFGAGAPQGCVIVDVLPGQAAPSTGGQVIAQLDDGTDNNRLLINNAAGGLTVVGDVIASGVSAGATASAGSLVVGTVARVGLRWGGGTIGVCKDAGAIQNLTAAVPAGLANLRIGNRVDLLRPWSSRIRPVRGASYAPSDAKFQAACAPGADIASILG